MKYLPLTILAFFILVAVSCKKNNPTVSHWKINNDSFSSANIQVSIDNGQSEMRSDGVNYYDFIFYGSGMSDDALIGVPPGAGVNMIFNYKGVQYYAPTISSSNTFLITKTINGKKYFYLQPTWFYGQSLSDTVLISGTFYHLQN